MKTQKLSGTKSSHVVVVILLAFFLFNNCQQKASVKEADEEQKVKEKLMTELVYTCTNIWSSGNLSLIDELWSPEIIRHSAGLDDAVGIDEYKKEAMIVSTAFPDINFSFDEIFIKDDKVIYRMTVSGTHTGPFLTPLGEIPPTGKKFSINACEIDRIVNGKIVEEWSYVDYLSLFTQIGFTLLPPENPDK